MIAYRGPRFTVEFLTRGGRCAAVEFLEAQDMSVQTKAGALFSRLGDTGQIRDTTKFRILAGSERIFEFKPTSDVRLLCFFAPGRRVIVTHGFVKKSPKTPPGEIARAERDRAEFLTQGG